MIVRYEDRVWALSVGEHPHSGGLRAVELKVADLPRENLQTSLTETRPEPRLAVALGRSSFPTRDITDPAMPTRNQELRNLAPTPDIVRCDAGEALIILA